ncbi:MAG: thiamine pyrophosphate-binding protein, partial [Bacteroidetes bacterium]|nr:thiamine pyrophosphate-binding protein [Bacteroidota bacterium]
MKVTTFIAQFLTNKGIKLIFELQGGMITRIIDEFHRLGEITIASMHHEQAAAFAVDAYSRITNKPGVAIATSGPGATNLITGIGSCYYDSVPAIFITGQVNLSEQKGDRSVRQIGFQETDITSIVQPITKASYAIKDADEIPVVFEKAYQLAIHGRPGPVLIDIPMDIQNTEINNMRLNDHRGDVFPKSGRTHIFLDQLIAELKYAKAPLVLAGRGIQTAGATSSFLKFIEKYNLPAVTSLLGLDVIPYNHPNRIGFIGTYGNRWANFALGTCDVLLVLGSRLDLRQTGSDVKFFKKGKKIFHVDIEPSELNNRIKNCIILEADVKVFLNEINLLSGIKIKVNNWRQVIRGKYLERKDIDELGFIKGINPNIFIHQLAHVSKLAKVIIADVGNNQMWVAQSYEVGKNQRFITSGGMGAMGYSLAAAIGACFASENLPVIAITGDGGMQINIQELQTIRRNNLPIKIVILNNHCLGMIRQFQDSYFDSCYQSTVWGYDAPDFETVAIAYGIDAYSISTIEEIEDGLKMLWKKPDQPFLLNVSLDVHTNVYPKIAFG